MNVYLLSKGDIRQYLFMNFLAAYPNCHHLKKKNVKIIKFISNSLSVELILFSSRHSTPTPPPGENPEYIRIFLLKIPYEKYVTRSTLLKRL